IRHVHALVDAARPRLHRAGHRLAERPDHRGAPPVRPDEGGNEAPPGPDASPKGARHMGKVRTAIVGVGNCASSLVQGLEYYKDADDGARVPGLMHVRFGPYHISDVEVVAAFDVDTKKVGADLAEAISASENNTIKIAEVAPTGVIV